MLKYNLHVTLQPEMHNGHMAHYWHITQTNTDGTFTIADGFGSTYLDAALQADKNIFDRGLVK